MKREPDEGFLRKLDDFNDAQGGPMRVAVYWSDKKERWDVWILVCGEPSSFGYDATTLKRLLKKTPDSKDGVRLFTWEKENGEYLPLDDRLLHALKLADSFSSRDHFKRTVEDPEAKKEAEMDSGLADVFRGAASYYYGFDNAVVGAGGGGNWRHRIR